MCFHCFDRREKCTRLMDIMLDLTVKKLGLSFQEGNAFRCYPDYRLLSEVVETTLSVACPGFDFPAL